MMTNEPRDGEPADPGASNPDGQVDAPPAAARSAAPPPARRRSGAWGCVVTLLQIALVLSVIGGLVVAFGVWQLQQSYRAPHATPAGVTWVSQRVEIDPSAAVVTGRVTMDVTGLPTAGVRVGVNAAAPAFTGVVAPPSASGNEPIAIGGPLVRLALVSADAPQSCIAPCELGPRPDFDCKNGTCRMVLEITLELVASNGAVGGPISITVSGGVSPGQGAPPPASASVDLSFDPAAPTTSGG